MVVGNDFDNEHPVMAETPNLPEDFFRSLLDLPSCIVNGYCDNCGRCEH